VVSNIIILTYIASFVNGVLSKRFQEKYMLILLHRKRKRSTISKKDRTDIYGCTAAAAAAAAAKNKVHNSIT
jgi:hypothetical protein